MSTPHYDPTVSLGHLLTVAAVIIGFGIAWGVHTTTLSYLERKDRDLENADAEMRLDIRAHQQQIQALHVTQEKTLLTLDMLQKSFQEYKQK